MKSVAVAILNYNGSALLRNLLPLVVAHSPRARVVVVDNGSTDDSQQIVQGTEGAEWLAVGSNLGYCGGYNFALSRLEEPFVVLLNSDVEVTAGWLDGPLELLQKDTRVAAVQPKIKSWHHREQFEYAGAAGGHIDVLGYPFCRGRMFDTLEKDEGQFDDRQAISWATGACMFVRRSAFLEVGGLDESFFAHMEEIDLCWRFSRAGYSVYYEGASTVFHMGGATLDASHPNKTYFNFRNGLAMLVKNLPASTLGWLLPLRLFLDWLAAMRFASQGKWSHAAAVFRAHGSLVGRLPAILSKRRKSSWAQAPIAHTYPGSVVYQYFIKGKKTFGSLPKPA
ncbi:MAG: glycosyltransferase family 2 protein [Cyclobacteriaceae bacterium]